MSFFGFKSNTCMTLAIIATTVVLTACGSSSDETLDAEAILAAQTPCSMSAHSGSNTGAVEKACVITSPSVSADPKLTCRPDTTTQPRERYSLVFKGCSAANAPEYYDKTECVRDNATGLIWQGQTAEGTGLRANDQYKTNYDSTTKLQKKDGNNYVAPTLADVNAVTNSIGFKNAVNATNLCGSVAWRLPTVYELADVVNPIEKPRIHNLWFPNAVPLPYWTSSPYSRNVRTEPSPYDGNAHIAWAVDFYDGNAVREIRSGFYGGRGLNLVRLVR